MASGHLSYRDTREKGTSQNDLLPDVPIQIIAYKVLHGESKLNQTNYLPTRLLSQSQTVV